MATLLLANGKLVDPMDIDFRGLEVPHFAHALSIVNRYTGNSRFPYSVAEHSVLLCDAVPQRLKRAAIIHDFPEMFVCDMPNPVKRELDGYREYEDKITIQIANHFEVPLSDLEELRSYDRRMCQDEMMQIMFAQVDIGLEPLGITVHGWGWRQARDMLIMRASENGFVV